jgi:hypothetical protein
MLSASPRCDDRKSFLVCMAASEEKLGMDPRISQLACCGLCREPFFSAAVALSITVDDFMKGCHIWGSPAGSVHRAYVDWRGKHMCRVDLGFPLQGVHQYELSRLSDMSNRLFVATIK